MAEVYRVTGRYLANAQMRFRGFIKQLHNPLADLVDRLFILTLLLSVLGDHIIVEYQTRSCERSIIVMTSSPLSVRSTIAKADDW